MSTHGTPASPGPLDGDVAGVPGRRPLLLVGLVVLVEHEHRAQPGTGAHAPARAPTATHPPAAARAQSRGSSATRTPVAAQAGGQEGGGGHRRGQHQGVARGRRPPAPAGGRPPPAACGRTATRRANASAASGPAVDAGDGSRRRRSPRRQATDRPGRRGRPRKADRRPAHRQAAQSARSTSVGRRPPPGDLGQRLQRTPSWRRRPVAQRHHPPADPAPVQRHPHHACRRGPRPPIAGGPGSRTSWRCRPRRARPGRSAERRDPRLSRSRGRARTSRRRGGAGAPR